MRYLIHLAMLGLLLAFTCASAKPVHPLERLEPGSGCYIGVVMGDNDTVARLDARLGLTPAAFTRFYSFPFSPSTRLSASAFLDEVRTSGGIAVLTLEPFGGLATVTVGDCDDLGNLCAQAESQGIGGIMIRFAHEMNGNWYTWGQKPALYRQTFQMMASAVHGKTTRTAMLWSPNNGVGYPYGSGSYSAAPGSSDYAELDTNGDGVLTQGDDMFGPFYPGDSYVDWVGLTIYHWGVSYPWLENEMPIAGEFANMMNASGPGVPADYSRWFYSRFCEDSVHRKPLAVAETAAFYNTQQPGCNELFIKQAWFRQIYNISGASAEGPDVAATFPKMKCVNWFDHYKRESEAQNQFIDWRASADPMVRMEFVNAVRGLRSGKPYFLTAQEFACLGAAYGLTAANLPAILPLSGNVSMTLNVKAQAGCDLEVDLLDQDFVFKGGTRVSVPAGSSMATASFPFIQSLKDGSSYRWSIFLTPTGGSYPNTLSRYVGPASVARAVQSAVAIEGAPASIAPGVPITARVKFTASTSGTVNVVLADSVGGVFGTGSKSVPAGDGLLDIILSQNAGNAAGSYILKAVFQPVVGPPTESTPRGILLNSTPVTDAVSLVVEPAMLPVGEVFRFTVSYAATAPRDLLVQLVNPAGSIVATTVQPVLSGAGKVDATISYPNATFGTYTARIFIVPPGGTSSQSTATSITQPVYVVSSDYALWTLSRWGIVLGNDPVLPQLDPDGDGARNQDEFVALTDPRNPASVFRTNVARSGSNVSVSWPTASGRNYQLFSRGALSGGTWFPAGSVQPGTGGTMQFLFDTNSTGPAQFYRVEISMP